jgi:hypothetical protein
VDTGSREENASEQIELRFLIQPEPVVLVFGLTAQGAFTP